MNKRTKYCLVGVVIAVCAVFLIIDAVPFTQEKAIAIAKATVRKRMTDDEMDRYEVSITREGIEWRVLFQLKGSPSLGSHFMVCVYTKYNVEIIPGK